MVFLILSSVIRDLIVCDQGGEFKGAFNNFCEEHGIDTRVVGSHAVWQHGNAERHGSTLGTMWRKLAYEFKVEDRKTADMVIACICQAKNSLMTRNGMTPEQAVFGRSLRFTEQAIRDDDEIMMQVLGAEGPA